MSRAPRVDVGDQIYHVINRANGRQTLFRSNADYQHFEGLLKEAADRTNMRILAYVVMPNHWHLLVCPKKDGDLSIFMQWLTLTHTQQYHVRKRTIGHGHIYQGRYKSFLVQKDQYLLAALKYIERNPVRAKLTSKVEGWRWGSGYRRLNGTVEEKILLAALPVDLPSRYRRWVNEPDKEDDLLNLRISTSKGKPFGTMSWTERTVERFGLEATMRKPGRPRNGT